MLYLYLYDVSYHQSCRKSSCRSSLFVYQIHRLPTQICLFSLWVSMFYLRRRTGKHLVDQISIWENPQEYSGLQHNTGETIKVIYSLYEDKNSLKCVIYKRYKLWSNDMNQGINYRYVRLGHDIFLKSYQITRKRAESQDKEIIIIILYMFSRWRKQAHWVPLGIWRRC